MFVFLLLTAFCPVLKASSYYLLIFFNQMFKTPTQERLKRNNEGENRLKFYQLYFSYPADKVLNGIIRSVMLLF